MSTSSANVIFNNTSGSVQFRAWSQALHDALIAIGLVQTADTGQVNLTTMTAPSLGTYAGFEMFRFADSLQATKPVFVKVEYGAGPQSGSQPAFRITVSNGTNGAGTLNGSLISTAQVIQGQYAVNDTAAQPVFFCGDTSSVVFAWPSSNATAGWRPSMVMIERTRNADGTPNGDGVVFATVQGYGHGSGASGYGDSTAQILSFLNNAVGPAYRWLPIASPGVYSFWDSAGSIGTDINLFPFQVVSPKPEAQALSVLGCYSLAQTGQTLTSVTVNGSAHTYISLGGQMYATFIPLPTASSWQNAANSSLGYGQNTYVGSLLMRYE